MIIAECKGGPLDGARLEMPSPYTHVYIQQREIFPGQLLAYEYRFVHFDEATKYSLCNIDQQSGDFIYEPSTETS